MRAAFGNDLVPTVASVEPSNRVDNGSIFWSLMHGFREPTLVRDGRGSDSICIPGLCWMLAPAIAIVAWRQILSHSPNDARRAVARTALTKTGHSKLAIAPSFSLGSFVCLFVSIC